MCLLRRGRRRAKAAARRLLATPCAAAVDFAPGGHKPSGVPGGWAARWRAGAVSPAGARGRQPCPVPLASQRGGGGGRRWPTRLAGPGLGPCAWRMRALRAHYGVRCRAGETALRDHRALAPRRSLGPSVRGVCRRGRGGSASGADPLWGLAGCARPPAVGVGRPHCRGARAQALRAKGRNALGAQGVPRFGQTQA